MLDNLSVKSKPRRLDWKPNHVKYKIEWLNGLSYVGDFWNRSHLIADSLGGDALRVNAVTGTRTQNVGGRDQKAACAIPNKELKNG